MSGPGLFEPSQSHALHFTSSIVISCLSHLEDSLEWHLKPKGPNWGLLSEEESYNSKKYLTTAFLIPCINLTVSPLCWIFEIDVLTFLKLANKWKNLLLWSKYSYSEQVIPSSSRLFSKTLIAERILWRAVSWCLNSSLFHCLNLTDRWLSFFKNLKWSGWRRQASFQKFLMMFLKFRNCSQQLRKQNGRHATHIHRGKF